MPKLNQIVALEKGKKDTVMAEVTKLHHLFQKPALFTGLERTYQPRDEEGEKLPPESTQVQFIVGTQLAAAAQHLTQLFDIVATKEEGNTLAKADVVVDGQAIVEDASVPLLLFLEKQLIHFRTLVSGVPVLSRAEPWEEDINSGGQWRTAQTETVRTKKVMRNHVKAEATDKHPAQVEVYTEDIPVGNWTTVKFSGAVPEKRRDELVQRVNGLLDAVKSAREEANGRDILQAEIGSAIFDYLLA